MTVDELVERLFAAVNDPDFKNRLAAEEAARTDPWRWYCRICGAEGEDASRLIRNEQADEHLATTRCGQWRHRGEAESGRLLHVWTYSLPSDGGTDG